MMKKFLAGLTAFVLSVLPTFVFASQVLAASATLYLSPGSGSVAQGSYLTVNIYENSGAEPVNGVQANLTYSSNLLDFVSIGSSSAFSVAAQSSGGGGSVQVGRGALPAVSGTQLVASVKFKAKANSGTASISFAGGSSVVSANSNSNIMSGSSGGSYRLTSPPPPAVKDTTPPTISDIKISAVGATSADISWTTSEPSTSEVNYGLNTSYGLASVDGAMVTAHKVTLASALITPGTTYHLLIKSTDPSGNTATSADQTFTTVGAKLVVDVRDKSNKPLKGAKVEIAGKSVLSDSQGQAVLTNMPLGSHTGAVTYRNSVQSFKVEILKADPANPTKITVKVKTPGSAWPLIGLLVLALAGAAWILRTHPEFMPNRIAHWHPGNRTSSGSSGPDDSNLNTPEKQPPPEVVKPKEPPPTS